MKTQKAIEKKQADLLKKINEIIGSSNEIIETTIDLKNLDDNQLYTHINFYYDEKRSMILNSFQLKSLAKLNIKLFLTSYNPHFYYSFL